MHSWTGLTISLGPNGLINFFMTVYGQLGQPLIRTAVWLGFKFLAFGLINFMNKWACYAMKDDIQVLMITFQLVLATPPPLLFVRPCANHQPLLNPCTNHQPLFVCVFLCLRIYPQAPPLSSVSAHVWLISLFGYVTNF